MDTANRSISRTVLPTIFSHSIFALAAGKALQPASSSWRFWLVTAACPILPDLDVISFAFGMSYASVLGHRGFTHSILFALFTSAVVTLLFFRNEQAPRWRLAAFFALVTASHPILDMLTDGGLGVALFAPFSNERFFFPWRPIKVSPLGVGFFSDRGLAVIMSEMVWIWIPSILLVLLAWLVRRKALMRE